MRKALSALADGLFVGILAASACVGVALTAYGADAMHVVQTAVETPIAIARAATAAPAPHAYVERTQWTRVGDRVSLRVYPTEEGRRASSGFVNADTAWAQVVAAAPEADTPGMRAQFVCHWRFAEIVEPGKVSWNLEPWRPVVSAAEMIETRCNPGGAEESI